MERGDCSYLLEGKDPSRILRKVLAILEHQVTKDDVDRQLKIINEFLIVSENGFLVRDLCNIMYLFDLMQVKVLADPSFDGPFIKLLDLCSLPPQLTRTLEVLEFATDIQEYFSWLGYMIIWLMEKKHQLKIIDAIYALLTIEGAEKCYVSLDVRKDKAHESKLADLFADMLEIVDQDVYLAILNVLQVLIDGSKETCVNLLKKGVVNTIILRLEPNWKERFPSIKPDIPTENQEILQTETIFYILISLLTHADTKVMRAPSKFTLWSLQWAFRLFNIKETTDVERNNVLAVLLLLMDIYPDVLLGNLTLAYDIAMLAMSSDIVFNQNWTSEIKLTTSNEDNNCMALLLMCVSYFPNFLTGPKVIEECRIVMGLLKLINNKQAIRWKQLQACYLIRLSLNILYKIVPASTEEFIEDGGPLTILQVLNRAREHSYYYNYDIVYRSIALLAHLTCQFKSIRDSVAYNGGVTCVLNLFQDLLKHSVIAEDNQKLLAVIIYLLEQISSPDEAFHVLSPILSYMKRYIYPSQSEPIHIPKVIVRCLSFIWNKIPCSTSNSKEFVKRGGIYLTLDIIQASCLPVKLIALGLLIDLCEKIQCISYFITWRSKGQGIKSLLMDIFRQENKELFVKADEHCILTHHQFPIMGETQYYETYCQCQKHIGNAAIGDMFISCRPKIYCLLQILNHKQNEIVEIANDVYKVYSEELSVEDEVSYVLAENFLALKLGEAWEEILQDLMKMGLQPIPSDYETLKTMSAIFRKWGSDLQKIQQDIFKNYRSKQQQEERALYNKLRESRLADSWDALCEMKYIARCSERLFRITSMFKLQWQISRSLQVRECNGQLHRTFQSDISVTSMQNQTVSIKHEAYEDLLPKTELEFVSPISSGCSSPRIAGIEPEAEYLPDTMLNQTKNECDQVSDASSCIFRFGSKLP